VIEMLQDPVSINQIKGFALIRERARTIDNCRVVEVLVLKHNRVNIAASEALDFATNPCKRLSVVKGSLKLGSAARTKV
jgi:hypothetical protein